MKRLFCVKDSKGRVYANAYYGDKQSAKAVRDGLNKLNLAGDMAHVSKGPDHIGNHGHGKTPKMRRQPKAINMDPTDI